MFETVWQCPLCKSVPDNHKLLPERTVGRLWIGKNELVPVYYAICEKCGLVFQTERLEDMNQFYMQGDYRKGVQGGSAEVGERIKSEQANRTEHLMSHIDIEIKSALDIGSSTGLFLEALRDKYDCKILGIEPGEAQRMSTETVAFSDISLLDNSYLNTFDFISMIHVLEHLKEPVDYLVNLHNFITDDGHLLVEVPHLYNESALLPAHTVAFNQDTLTLCLNRAGFEVVWIKEYEGIKVGYPNPANILVLARPGKVSDKLPSVDIDEVLSLYNAGQEALRKFTHNEGTTGETK